MVVIYGGTENVQYSTEKWYEIPGNISISIGSDSKHKLCRIKDDIKMISNSKYIINCFILINLSFTI